MQILIEAYQAVDQHPWAQLVWKSVAITHHDVMPWIGWCLAVLVLILGPVWFWRTMRRAGRALNQWVRTWRSRRKMIQESIRRHLVTQEMFENCATPGLIEEPPHSRQAKG